MGQSITQLNFNQNYLSLGPQSSKLPVRNYIYQPLISNGNIHPQCSEIRRMFWVSERGKNVYFLRFDFNIDIYFKTILFGITFFLTL